jgi:DNA-binding transcriptional LysR family regulator
MLEATAQAKRGEGTSAMRPINFRTLDLNLLRVFDAVMVEGHVTRAALQLSMTQPAVSNALRRLRVALREDLFIPGPNGVRPTAYAQGLWPGVREALNHLAQLITPQGFDAGSETRDFTVAMTDATAALFVPVLVAALTRSQVNLHVVGLASRDPRALLEQGQADLAVGFFPDVRAALAAQGEAALTRLEPLYSCRYQCVMRQGHPLAASPRLSLQAYCAADHLRVNFASRPLGYVDETLARLGVQRRVMLTVNHFATAGAVVHQSDLLTVLPRSYVPATGYADQLVLRGLPFALPTIDVGLLWHRRHEQDTAQRWLRDLLARAAVSVAGPVASDQVTQ